MQNLLMNSDKKKVLILDDDFSSRKLLSQLIRNNFNCEVSQSDDGSDALKMMLQDPPDVLILDMVMPFMSGVQVLQTMRKNQRLSQIPVFACTSIDDNNVVQQIIKLGVREYIKKPIKKEQVLEKLNAVFSA